MTTTQAADRWKTGTPGRAHRVATDGWAERTVRAGWMAKAAVYALVALLAYRLATGGPGEEASPTGAVRYLAEQPLGTALLVALAAGLVAYAAGRILRATVLADPGDGAVRRLGYGVVALVYLGLAAAAGRTALGSGAGQSSDQRSQQATSTAFDLPLGRWLVAAVGVALLAYALHQAREGITRRFADSLRDGEMDGRVRPAAIAVSVAGLVAHGVALGLIGFFLVQAAVTHDPNEAVGLDGALQRVASGPAGTALILLTAAGLLAYAAHCVVLARYQRVP